MTSPSDFNAMPTQAGPSARSPAPGSKTRFSRGQVSFWLWAVAAPLGAVLIATHNWLTI